MKKLLPCLYLLASLSAIAAPTGPEALIHKDIDKLVAVYSDGFAYSNAKMRHLAFGPLFHKDRRDAVAFFALGGVDNSNVHFEYIAIFAQGQGRDMSEMKGPKERPYHLLASSLVGGRGVRTLDWQTARISKGQIVVQGTRWVEEDAGCCPSKAIEVTFNISTKVVDELSPERYPILTESEGPGKAAAKK